MNEKNLLDKMSLIDIDYVEAAEYPKIHKFKAIRNKRILKAAVAAAALFIIGIGCVCFNSQTTAVADNLFFENSVFFEDHEIKEKMGIVKIKNVPSRAWEKNYDTLEDVEKLLGITLLKSTKNYDAPVPSVNIEKSYNGKEIVISDIAYYMYNEIVLSMEENSIYYKKLGDNAYRVSYTARFFSEFDCRNKIESDYTSAVFIKNYTTAHNLKASLFYEDGQFHALIYHNNVRYKIDMEIWDQTSVYLGKGNETKPLEDFLDTLS